MKVIFLDVDGVLNNVAAFEAARGRNGTDVLSRECVERCNQLVARTGARIVLSSTWRLIKDFRGILRDGGLRASIIDRTPYFTDGDRRRGAEIADWLRRNGGDVARYVILDDDSDMLEEQLPYFVQTTFELGLTDEHVERAVAILGAV